MNLRLKHENDTYSEEIKRSREEVSRSRDTIERQVSEQRATWMEEKTNLQLRVEELERELEKIHSKVVGMINSYKKVRFKT